MMLGVWAYPGALVRAGMVGGDQYIQELGFPSQAESEPASEPDIATSLRQLESLRAEGLITEPEYNTKRDDILSRI